MNLIILISLEIVNVDFGKLLLYRAKHFAEHFAIWSIFRRVAKGFAIGLGLGPPSNSERFRYSTVFRRVAKPFAIQKISIKKNNKKISGGRYNITSVHSLPNKRYGNKYQFIRYYS